LSQEKLGEKSELSTVFINRVEAGRENISVDALQRIAKALKIELRELFSGRGNSAAPTGFTGRTSSISNRFVRKLYLAIRAGCFFTDHNQTRF